jgi:hypothetical protein
MCTLLFWILPQTGYSCHNSDVLTKLSASKKFSVTLVNILVSLSLNATETLHTYCHSSSVLAASFKCFLPSHVLFISFVSLNNCMECLMFLCRRVGCLKTLYPIPAYRSGRAVWSRNCLRPLKHWDHGFESQSKHVCLCVIISVFVLFCV